MATLRSVHVISSDLGFEAGKGPETRDALSQTRCPLQHAAAQSNMRHTALMRTHTGDNGTALKTASQEFSWTQCTTLPGTH